MSERYTRVFSLPADLYAAGSPVVIAAGGLLKDNQTGAILAQLKFRNISPNAIIGLKIRLRLFDNFRSVLGDPVEYEYLDLCAERDTEFGQKYPILISELRARMYKVTVTSVVFEDHSIWNASGETWKSLGSPTRLMFYDPELQKQYKLQFGPNSVYKPLIDRDLWYCTCGVWNRKGELCHKCLNSLSALQAMDLAKLTSQKDARLAREAVERAAKIAAQEAAAAETKQKREQQKKAVISAITTPVVAAKQKSEAAIATAKQKKDAAAARKQEQEAVAAAEKQKKEAAAVARRQEKEAAATARKQEKEAIAASRKQKKEAAAAARKQKQEAAVATKQKPDRTRKIVIITICTTAVLISALLYIIPPAMKYRQALSLKNAGQYEQAIAAFEAMDGYRDSAQQIELCREGIRENAYQDALVLMEQAAYSEAIAAFQELRDYKDSEALILDCDREIVLLRKEEADKLMEAWKYEQAVAVYKEVEELGIDCSEEIRKCETAILNTPGVAPYVTVGKPTGTVKKVQYSVLGGNVTVYSLTSVELDNACVRFTLDCTPPKCDYVSFFDDRQKNYYQYVDWNGRTGERETFVVDILKEDIKKTNTLVVLFGKSKGSGSSIFVRNAY